MKAKGLEFAERQPARNAKELAERTAGDASKAFDRGVDKTKTSLKELD
jgi:hypothetical protein